MPLQIPRLDFNKWNKITLIFIWSNRRQQNKLKTSPLQREEEGLSVTNLQNYF